MPRMNLNLTTIEQGIKAVLAEHMSKHMPYVREIKSYNGDFDNLLVAASEAPAIWVSFKKADQPRQITQAKIENSAIFSVLVVARQTASLDFGQSHLGSYSMLQEVQKILVNNDLSNFDIQGLAPLKLGQTETLLNSRNTDTALSIISQDIVVKYATDVRQIAKDRDTQDQQTAPVFNFPQLEGESEQDYTKRKIAYIEEMYLKITAHGLPSSNQVQPQVSPKFNFPPIKGESDKAYIKRKNQYIHRLLQSDYSFDLEKINQSLYTEKDAKEIYLIFPVNQGETADEYYNRYIKYLNTLLVPEVSDETPDFNFPYLKDESEADYDNRKQEYINKLLVEKDKWFLQADNQLQHIDPEKPYLVFPTSESETEAAYIARKTAYLNEIMPFRYEPEFYYPSKEDLGETSNDEYIKKKNRYINKLLYAELSSGSLESKPIEKNVLDEMDPARPTFKFPRLYQESTTDYMARRTAYLNNLKTPSTENELMF